MGIRLVGGPPPGVEPYWTLASLANSDNAGAVVRGSLFSDGYARAGVFAFLPFLDSTEKIVVGSSSSCNHRFVVGLTR